MPLFDPAFLSALAILNFGAEMEAATDSRTAPYLGSFPLARMPVRHEELGLFINRGRQRLLIRDSGAWQEPQSLPLLSNLLGRAKVLSFGVEERCRAEEAGSGGITILCSGGSSPAGAILQFDGRSPRQGAIQGRIEAAGTSGFSAQSITGSADADAAVPVTFPETRLPLAQSATAPARMVIVAPAGGGTLRLSGMALESMTRPAASSREDGGWAWEPRLWSRAPDQLLEAAVRRGLRRVYVGLAITNGRLQGAPALSRFIRKARGRGILVEAVEGDPNMVHRDGLARALARAAAIARYQAEAPADARLAAVQYDIEPYSLEGWGSYPADYRGWSEAVRALAAGIGGRVHLVLPFWIAGDDRGRRFLEEVRPSISLVTAMAYRTDPALLTVISEPLLTWGVENGCPVRIALEAGRVAEEREEIFRAAERGQIALLPRADGSATALLLGGVGKVEGAAMYALSAVERAAPEQVSFLGDEQAMRNAAEQIRPALAGWSSFAGLSFHGLDWRK